MAKAADVLKELGIVRPDHGRHLEIDRARTCYSGYDYGGRLVGLAELRGLVFGLEHEMQG